MKRRTFIRICALAAPAVFTGCAGYISRMVAVAPNYGARSPVAIEASQPAQTVFGLADHFRVKVGPPEASLSVSRIDSKLPDDTKGTILVLHGLGARAAWMLGAAHKLADAGYRVFLVDLRGQGGSTGDWLTYGLRESRDLVEVMNYLQRHNLAVGSFGVYGMSYGATTAIHLAARDNRIRSVVAVAPFSSLREAAPGYIHTVLPGIGHAIGEDSIQSSIDKAGGYAGFDPDDADAVTAIKLTKVPILLVHGSWDQLVAFEHSERLHEAAPQNSRLLVLPAGGHLGVWLDITGSISKHSVEWFDTYLAKE